MQKAAVEAVAEVAPGYAELDPVRLQTAGVEAVAEVMTEVRQRGDRVVGLCLSAAMHGLVPLDGVGAPTGPLITWADSRAGEESRSLAESSTPRPCRSMARNSFSS